MTRLFCFGLGYCAHRVAQELSAGGWAIAGTSTSEAGAEALRRSGFEGFVFDGTQRLDAVTGALARSTHILLSIPPGPLGDAAYILHAQDIAAAPHISWIGYFSTVGVYGDAAGGWVDENTEAKPASERGQRRLVAENAWRQLGRDAGKRVNVFRLPGIYGPGRSAIDDVLAGTARRIIKPGQVFNRIHVEDIARAVIAAIAKPQADHVYNVTDDEPGPPQDVVAFAAQLLGLPVPPDLDFATADLSPMARSFYSESKRVSNARLKAELLPRLAYPTYRQGLTAIARALKK